MKKYLRVGVLTLCWVIAGRVVCQATQPDCVGNRHMDECGDFCPVVTTTTTTTLDPATSTTLPDACGPCPTVQCPSGNETVNNTLVVVNRCPAMPTYRVCRYVHGKMKCPNKYVPHRVLVPASPPNYLP